MFFAIGFQCGEQRFSVLDSHAVNGQYRIMRIVSGNKTKE